MPDQTAPERPPLSKADILKAITAVKAIPTEPKDEELDEFLAKKPKADAPESPIAPEEQKP